MARLDGLEGRLLRPGDEGYDDARALYARIAEVKAAWDPANVFRGNQSVEPARARARVSR